MTVYISSSSRCSYLKGDEEKRQEFNIEIFLFYQAVKRVNEKNNNSTLIKKKMQLFSALSLFMDCHRFFSEP